MALRRDARKAHIALEFHPGLRQKALQRQPAQAERERKRPGEALVAAPKLKTARNDLQQKRINRPDRKARETDAVGPIRHLHLVVNTGLAPGLDELDAPQTLATAETDRIDVTTRPVDAARLRQRFDVDRNGRRKFVGENDRRLHHRPRVGTVRRIVTYLHLDGRFRQ